MTSDDTHWPDFENRRAHAFNKIRDTAPHDLNRGKFLDIGCGTGNGVIAAAQNGFALSVGIDRDFNEFHWFEIDRFASVCRHYGVDPVHTMMVQGDIFNCKFEPKSFDFVLMLDSIEHVPDPESFIRIAADYVANDGVLVIDTCPLYFGRVGHHLFSQFDDETPWAHLRHDFAERSLAFDDWSMTRFAELNKVTHNQVVGWMRDAQLEVVLEHRDIPTQEDEALLDQHRASLCLDDIDEKTLFENWLLVVGRRCAA